MKVKGRRLFSLVQTDTEYFNDNQDKIELLDCQQDEKICKNYLPEINNYFHESDMYFRDKQFQKSIEALKNAFYTTEEFRESSCSKCAEFIQSVIIQSLENIHDELRKMSTGLFSTKRYQLSCNEAEKVLKEFKSSGNQSDYTSRRKKKNELAFAG